MRNLEDNRKNPEGSIYVGEGEYGIVEQNKNNKQISDVFTDNLQQCVLLHARDNKLGKSVFMHVNVATTKENISEILRREFPDGMINVKAECYGGDPKDLGDLWKLRAAGLDATRYDNEAKVKIVLTNLRIPITESTLGQQYTDNNVRQGLTKFRYNISEDNIIPEKDDYSNRPKNYLGDAWLNVREDAGTTRSLRCALDAEGNIYNLTTDQAKEWSSKLLSSVSQNTSFAKTYAAQSDKMWKHSTEFQESLIEERLAKSSLSKETRQEVVNDFKYLAKNNALDKVNIPVKQFCSLSEEQLKDFAGASRKEALNFKVDQQSKNKPLLQRFTTLFTKSIIDNEQKENFLDTIKQVDSKFFLDSKYNDTMLKTFETREEFLKLLTNNIRQEREKERKLEEDWDNDPQTRKATLKQTVLKSNVNENDKKAIIEELVNIEPTLLSSFSSYKKMLVEGKNQELLGTLKELTRIQKAADEISVGNEAQIQGHSLINRISSRTFKPSKEGENQIG